MFVVIVLIVLIAPFQVMGKTTYTVLIKDGKILGLAENGKAKTFDVANGFPETADLGKVMKHLINNKGEPYKFKDNPKLKNIFPWDLKNGNRYRFTYDNSVIQSQKTPISADETKGTFYRHLANVLLVFLLSAIGVAFLGSKQKKGVVLAIFLAIVGISIIAFLVTVGYASIGSIAGAGSGIIIGFIAGPIKLKSEIVHLSEIAIIIGAVIALAAAYKGGFEIASLALLELLGFFALISAITMAVIRASFLKKRS